MTNFIGAITPIYFDLAFYRFVIGAMRHRERANVQRRFNPDAPNQIWTGDITYLPTDEGWVYLAGIIDLHSRQLIGWSMKPHILTSLVRDALAMALFRRRPAAGVIFHSDRGSPVLQP